jgi:hypothetical protein
MGKKRLLREAPIKFSHNPVAPAEVVFSTYSENPKKLRLQRSSILL